MSNCRYFNFDRSIAVTRFDRLLQNLPLLVVDDNGKSTFGAGVHQSSVTTNAPIANCGWIPVLMAREAVSAPE